MPKELKGSELKGHNKTATSPRQTDLLLDTPCSKGHNYPIRLIILIHLPFSIPTDNKLRKLANTTFNK